MAKFDFCSKNLTDNEKNFNIAVPYYLNYNDTTII